MLFNTILQIFKLFILISVTKVVPENILTAYWI